jgi:hypothetical protein
MNIPLFPRKRVEVGEFWRESTDSARKRHSVFGVSWLLGQKLSDFFLKAAFLMAVCPEERTTYTSLAKREDICACGISLPSSTDEPIMPFFAGKGKHKTAHFRLRGKMIGDDR